MIWIFPLSFNSRWRSWIIIKKYSSITQALLGREGYGICLFLKMGKGDHSNAYVRLFNIIKCNLNLLRNLTYNLKCCS